MTGDKVSDFLTKMRTLVQDRVNTMTVPTTVPPNQLDFCQAFSSNQINIIAEMKFASPSRGVIYQGTLSPVEIAHSYLENGAAALSILTEPHYFKGHIDYLQAVRRAHPTANLLLKDFVLSEKQLIQAVMSGANGVLLIVAFLDVQLLQDLHQMALALGLTPIVEVHSLEELEIAVNLAPKIIGINNRNLKTLQIDLSISETLIQRVPQSAIVVCESGIESAEKMQAMRALGFNTFLIGSHFMKNTTPGVALQHLLEDVAHAG
ncbi:MAG: indole-3-glycerol-phosphate synthase [Gammaproteobacteria bacterium]|nr:indole-3-glycerol-phosphate synthase [Gammaproteobacteria bacterium]